MIFLLSMDDDVDSDLEDFNLVELLSRDSATSFVGFAEEGGCIV